MTSSAEWYYAKGGTRYGPVSMDQLKELAARGKLGPDDLVWREGLETWVRARTIPDLPFPPPVAKNSGGHAVAVPDVTAGAVTAAPRTSRRSGRPRRTSFPDLQLRRYWTPTILRFNWLTTLVIAAAVLFDGTYLYLRWLIDPSSDPHSIIVVPVLRAVVVASAGAARLGKSDRGLLTLGYGVFVVALFYVILWTRVALEFLIVVFNIAEHARNIDSQTKTTARRRRAVDPT